MADYSGDMSLKIGIVGLPNVGKSTLFNALTKLAAKAQNVPFTTIEPNIGVVAVPDERLDKLAVLSQSAKIVPTAIEFVDIAGLVRGAHEGEGLGNKFLANTREVDAIAHVVRFFDNPQITHVEMGVDPMRDAETVNLELALADLAMVEKMRNNLIKKIRSEDKEAKKTDELLAILERSLKEGKPAREIVVEEELAKFKKNINLLTDKPVLYVANVSETQLAQPDKTLSTFVEKYKDVLPLSVKIEQELNELDDAERQVYLKEYGLEQTGLNRLIKASYTLLNLITFLTTGPMESRAWTVHRGSLAPVAAGKIHSDMEQGFIRAETVAYIDLAAAGSYAAARSQGKVRDEGKEYEVQDGDVMIFKFAK